MWTTVFIISIAICAGKWLKWKIATIALIYYIEKNQHKLPSDEEMMECTDFVVRNTLEELLHLKE